MLRQGNFKSNTDKLEAIYRDIDALDVEIKSDEVLKAKQEELKERQSVSPAKKSDAKVDVYALSSLQSEESKQAIIASLDSSHSVTNAKTHLATARVAIGQVNFMRDDAGKKVLTSDVPVITLSDINLGHTRWYGMNYVASPVSSKMAFGPKGKLDTQMVSQALYRHYKLALYAATQHGVNHVVIPELQFHDEQVREDDKVEFAKLHYQALKSAVQDADFELSLTICIAKDEGDTPDATLKEVHGYIGDMDHGVINLTHTPPITVVKHLRAQHLNAGLGMQISNDQPYKGYSDAETSTLEAYAAATSDVLDVLSPANPRLSAEKIDENCTWLMFEPDNALKEYKKKDYPAEILNGINGGISKDKHASKLELDSEGNLIMTYASEEAATANKERDLFKDNGADFYQPPRAGLTSFYTKPAPVKTQLCIKSNVSASHDNVYPFIQSAVAEKFEKAHQNVAVQRFFETEISRMLDSKAKPTVELIANDEDGYAFRVNGDFMKANEVSLSDGMRSHLKLVAKDNLGYDLKLTPVKPQESDEGQNNKADTEEEFNFAI